MKDKDSMIGYLSKPSPEEKRSGFGFVFFSARSLSMYELDLEFGNEVEGGTRGTTHLSVHFVHQEVLMRRLCEDCEDSSE
jgi:hypothetical protein